MAALARVPLSVRSAAEADAALASWRERLAAAGRNVVELSELPAFLAVKAQRHTGRTAEAARRLVATMDELWQGVLLIGAAIDRADAARHGGSRLWRNDEAATEAMAILEGASIEVPTGELAVLQRSLLGNPRACVHVTPQQLLAAMEQAFERAKGSIETVSRAAARADATRAELLDMLTALSAQGWPGLAEAQARLDAAPAEDPLGALEQLDALRPSLVAARQQRAAADAELQAAWLELASLAELRGRCEQEIAACRAATDAALSAPDPQQWLDITAWLDRLAGTERAGQFERFRVGLTRWRELAAKLRADGETQLSAARAALARREELRGRFGALRAKQAARAVRLGVPDPEADAAAGRLQAALFGTVTRLQEAERLMALYEAALARPPARHG